MVPPPAVLARGVYFENSKSGCATRIEMQKCSTYTRCNEHSLSAVWTCASDACCYLPPKISCLLHANSEGGVGDMGPQHRSTRCVLQHNPAPIRPVPPTYPTSISSRQVRQLCCRFCGVKSPVAGHPSGTCGAAQAPHRSCLRIAPLSSTQRDGSVSPFR